jgi:hypothetical protein
MPFGRIEFLQGDAWISTSAMNASTQSTQCSCIMNFR